MFSSVSGFHFHPEPRHVPGEPHQPGRSAPSVFLSIHAPGVDALSGNADASAGPRLPADYVSKPSGKLYPDLVHPGIQIDDRGQRFIHDGANAYAVRFDRDNQTERVFQPDNPAKPGIPVRLNGAGEYERHRDVGLKGGSPGREIQSAYNVAKGSLERCRREVDDAKVVLESIENEIRRSPDFNADAQTRLQAANQVLRRREADLRGAEDYVEGVRQQARQLRQRTQDELTRMQARRQDGVRSEAATQLEINLLQVTPFQSGVSVTEVQGNLRRRQDDLRRVQDANAALDRNIDQLNRDLADVPYL
ncbi:hypothetical protein [Paraburkholderia sp. BL21I4N1]|uniref:hypothetical protein n=1 Tax=Paraburkholderia sp. BL21I4N1 TaxID=1938801 RepID=UPI000D42D6F6|nr:hypothetical protein [Paraburkholderia sp. BL21I4N1]PQV54436.1 hypothetical protein B0G83_101618 [Paraburkholderia sp. BL21I4N1]